MQKGKMLCSAMMTEQAQSIKDFFYRKRFRSSGLRHSWSSSKCTRRTRLKLSHFDWTSLVNSRLIIKQYDFTLIRIKSGFFFFFWVLGKIANCVCSTIILQNRFMFSLFWLSFLVLFLTPLLTLSKNRKLFKSIPQNLFSNEIKVHNPKPILCMGAVSSKVDNNWLIESKFFC